MKIPRPAGTYRGARRNSSLCKMYRASQRAYRRQRWKALGLAKA